MSLTARWRAHRARSRQSRDFARALNRASTPALRNELLTIESRYNGPLR